LTASLQSFETRRLNAQQAYRQNPSKEKMKAIIDASEAAAEAAADAHFALGKGYTKLACELPGKGKQGQFDRVYAKKDAQGNITEVVVVECKGGASPLGGRKGNQQGSKAYLLDIVENLRLFVKNNPGNSNLKSTLKELDESIEDKVITT
jgi:hypothetical protein